MKAGSSRCRPPVTSELGHRKGTMSTTSDSVLAGPPAPLTCGRCRHAFPGEGDAHQGLETGWWACAACRQLLFGAGAKPAQWRVPDDGPVVAGH